MGKLFNPAYQRDRRKCLRNNQTKAEWLLWLELKNRQIGWKFRRQFGIGPYIVDFYCPKLRLVIEVDGDSHFSEEGMEYDEARLMFLLDKDLHVLRFTNNDVYKKLDNVLEVIKHQFPKDK